MVKYIERACNNRVCLASFGGMSNVTQVNRVNIELLCSPYEIYKSYILLILLSRTAERIR